MALKAFRRLVDNRVFSAAAITITQPAIQTNNQGYPAGEEFFQGLSLRLYGSLNLTTSSAGTTLAGGVFRFLRNVYFETDKHGPIVNNVDGLSLVRLHRLLNGTEAAYSDISANTTGTPAFTGSLFLPFAIPSSLRPEDSHLYMKSARGKLTWQGGVFTDFISGGTYSDKDITSISMQQVASVKAHENGSPLLRADMPVYKPFYELKKVPVTATTSGQKIELPYGDRIYMGIAISQRNNSTLAELDNTVIGRTANIRLEKNNMARINTIHWGDVQDETKRIFGIEALPAGWGVILSCGDLHKPAQISEMLDTVDTAQGTLNLFVDTTAVSNGDVWVLTWGFMPIKSTAAFADLPADLQADLMKTVG